MKQENMLLKNEIGNIKQQLDQLLLKDRKNNLEIMGIEIKKEENLETIIEKISTTLKIGPQEDNIKKIYRDYISKKKNIIVELNDVKIKEKWLIAAKSQTNQLDNGKIVSCKQKI